MIEEEEKKEAGGAELSNEGSDDDGSFFPECFSTEQSLAIQEQNEELVDYIGEIIKMISSGDKDKD